MSVVVLTVTTRDHRTITARLAQLAEDRPPVWRYRLLDLRKVHKRIEGKWHVVPGVTELHVIDLPETFQFKAPQPPSVTVLSDVDVKKIIRDGRFLWWA